MLTTRAVSGIVAFGLIACAVAISSAEEVRKRRLSTAVNTATHRELLPVVSPDAKTLWFIREGLDTALVEGLQQSAAAVLLDLEAQMDRFPAEQRAELAKIVADMKKSASAQPAAGVQKQTIWVSERQSDGSWGAAVRAPSPLNDDVSPTGVVTALPDGNTLLAGRFDVAQFFNNMLQTVPDVDSSDPFAALTRKPKPVPLPVPDASRDDQNTLIGFSTRTDGGWKTLQLLRIIGYAHKPNTRSDYYLAPSGRTLMLSLVNSESLAGSRDLFVSQRHDDGRWSKPAIAPVLNSPSDEISPWLSPDNQTLYFASNRKGGLGDFDIWMSRRLDDSWLKWSAPVNLGAEINTPQADMNLAVDATGRYAFMSIGEPGQEDIYEFELPKAMRPAPVAFVRGRVTDPAGRPVPAGILYELLRTAGVAGQATSEPGEGRYQIALPIGEHYGFRASAAGYIAISDRIDLREAKDQQVYERDLVLVPIAPGIPIRLNNIFFETAKTTLLPESRAELDRLVSLLRDMPGMRIEIRGHTDAVDDDAFNLALSNGRAAAVVSYLVSAGIRADRLRSRGFGESQLVAPNDTEKNRQKNRRVEFVVLD